MGIEYAILYYGPTGGGTLNDRLNFPLINYQKTEGKIYSYIVNQSYEPLYY